MKVTHSEDLVLHIEALDADYLKICNFYSILWKSVLKTIKMNKFLST